MTLYRKKSRFLSISIILLVIIFLLPISTYANEDVPLNTSLDSKETDDEVILGGSLFGVRIITDGVLVVGIDGIKTKNGELNPAYDAGIKIGDVIKKVNNVNVRNTSEVNSIVSSSNGMCLKFVINRDGVDKNIDISPVKNLDNVYKIGIWIRDSAAGIGTITYINDENNEFFGLGHGICDSNTTKVLPIFKGLVTSVDFKEVIKGKSGLPGELHGVFKKDRLGTLLTNTSNGVSGIFTEIPCNLKEKIFLANKEDIHEGKAKIRSTVSNETEEYEVYISKIDLDSEIGKNFVIEITDERLLNITGGIIQGMSGSPVIQDGKLVGAVTHVTVNDPKKGYGIFIRNMDKSN